MRYPNLKPEEMSAQQRQILDKINQEQPEGLSGSYGSLIHAPEIAGLVYELDKYLVAGLRIPERLRIIAVLTAAAKYGAEDVQKFMNPADIALNEIALETVQAIKTGKHPISAHDDENMVHEFVAELARTGRVGDDCFDRLGKAFGREVCLELVKIAGFTIFMNNVTNITSGTPAQGTA